MMLREYESTCVFKIGTFKNGHCTLLSRITNRIEVHDAQLERRTCKVPQDSNRINKRPQDDVPKRGQPPPIFEVSCSAYQRHSSATISTIDSAFGLGVATLTSWGSDSEARATRILLITVRSSIKMSLPELTFAHMGSSVAQSWLTNLTSRTPHNNVRACSKYPLLSVPILICRSYWRS